MTTKTQYSFLMSEAVACAMSFDDETLRREMGVANIHMKSLKNGFRITGTLDELALIARYMERENGWDMPSQTMRACNRAAIKLRTFIATERSKDVTAKLLVAKQESRS